MGELHVDPSIAVVSTIVVLLGYGVAFGVYRKGMDRAVALKNRLRPVYALLDNKYYFDDFYAWLVRGVQQSVAVVCRAFEEWVVVRGLVGVPVAATRWVADRSRRLQAGRLNFYAYCFAGGVTLLLVLFFVLFGGGR
jgi:NADH-quinone oxidoreductase subunit L